MSASEAVRAALRLLEQEEARCEALMHALDAGEVSGECNESFASIVQEALLASCAGKMLPENHL
jgi:antitoxin ParD1/3/4